MSTRTVSPDLFRGAFEDGSLAALVIVLVGLLPVIQLVRSAEARPKTESSGS